MGAMADLEQLLMYWSLILKRITRESEEKEDSDLEAPC